MTASLSNPLLVETNVSSLLKGDGRHKATRLSSVRVEPAFVFVDLPLTCCWRCGPEIVFEQTRRVSRNDVAVFLTVPGFLDVASISAELSLGNKRVLGFTLDFVGPPCSRLESAEFSRQCAGLFDGTRYDLQTLPFNVMLNRAGEARKAQGRKVVFITGSVGKTTTKELLSHVLERRFAVCRSTDSWNLPHEISSQIALNAEWAEVFVMEVALDAHMKALATHVIPDHLIITHLGPVHTVYSTDVSEIGNLKASLATHMADTGIVTYNADVPEITGCLDRALVGKAYPPQRLSVGTGPSSQVRCTVADGGFLIADGRTGEQVFLPSDRNSLHENIVAAVFAVCTEFGLSTDEVAAAIASFPGVPFRLNNINFGGTLLLADCYNANPISMQGLLRRVAELRVSGRSACVIFGEMLDLGEAEGPQHDALITSVQETADAAILIGNRYSRETDWQGPDRHWFPDVNALLASGLLESYVDRYGVIAVKGSNRTGLMRAANRLIEILGNSGSNLY